MANMRVTGPTGTGIGMLDNVSNDLSADFTFIGKASDTLAVSVTPLALTKSFTDDPALAGGTAAFPGAVCPKQPARGGEAEKEAA